MYSQLKRPPVPCAAPASLMLLCVYVHEDIGLLFSSVVFSSGFASKTIVVIFFPVLFYGANLRRTDVGSSGNAWSKPAMLVQVLLKWVAFKQQIQKSLLGAAPFSCLSHYDPALLESVLKTPSVSLSYSLWGSSIIIPNDHCTCTISIAMCLLSHCPAKSILCLSFNEPALCHSHLHRLFEFLL